MKLHPDDYHLDSGPAAPTPAMEQAYAALMEAHEHAATFGRPLLTEAGASFLRLRLRFQSASASPAGLLPFWDAQGRRLWLDGAVLKVFRQPAPNQTRLLDVFQETGWIETHIDDPLPPEPHEDEQDVKRRLHETLKNLNRGLPRGSIRFRGDGTGQGVRWEYDHSGS